MWHALHVFANRTDDLHPPAHSEEPMVAMT